MSGNGVVTGLTEISTIKAKEKAPDGSVHTCPGELYYRGYNICDWSAHRLEKLQNAGKIIRPAYIGVKPVQNMCLLKIGGKIKKLRPRKPDITESEDVSLVLA